MKKVMKKTFGGLKMSWITVLLFALIVGIYTGFIMLVPSLKETSFQDIGVTYECWVIFAVIIVVNCKKNWEAMLKCFIFFLISQPVIYGVEILFGSLTIDMFMDYYRFWFILTILTLPGGFIAYNCKRQNLIGAVILGLGNTIQVVMGIHYLSAVCRDFPHHLLSVILCFASIFVMSFSIQEKKSNRLVAIFLPFVLMIVLFVGLKMVGRTIL